MRLSLAALLLSCVLAPKPAFASDVQVKHLEPQVMVVKVSAQGDVTGLDYVSKAPAAIRDRLSAHVRLWKFAPHRVDGQPVAWATRLTVWLLATPDTSGFRLSVDRAETNNLEVSRGGYPDMPVGLSRSFRQAQVCADFSQGADGKTNTIEALWVDDKPVGEDNPFMRSIRRSLGAWKFAPLVVDGVAYPSGSARASVVFSAQGADGASLVFSLKCQLKPATPVGDFRLLTPVAGTVLGEPPTAR